MLDVLILLQPSKELSVALSWLHLDCDSHSIEHVMLSSVHNCIWTLSNLCLFVDHRQKDSSTAATQSTAAA